MYGFSTIFHISLALHYKIIIKNIKIDNILYVRLVSCCQSLWSFNVSICVAFYRLCDTKSSGEVTALK